VHYASETLQQRIKQAIASGSLTEPTDRLGVQSDSLALARAGIISSAQVCLLDGTIEARATDICGTAVVVASSWIFCWPTPLKPITRSGAILHRIWRLFRTCCRIRTLATCSMATPSSYSSEPVSVLAGMPRKEKATWMPCCVLLSFLDWVAVVIK
jgi:hypothetical protein